MKFTFLCREPLYSARKRIAVIGAGPAGLTATGYFVCRGYEVDVYDKLPYPGGLMTFAIPRHRIPFEEILDGWRDLEKNFSVKFYLKTKVAIGNGYDEGDEFVERRLDLLELSRNYDGVIISTGTWRSRKLGIEGENSRNVITALSFLYHQRLKELKLSNGDTQSFGKAIIIGAGLSAIDAAEECLSIGVKEVYIMYRRSVKEAPAGVYKINSLIDRGVKFVELVQPKKIISVNGFAKSVEFIRVRLGGLDESGRPKPIPIEGSEFTMEADLIIAAIGETPTPPIYSGELIKYIGIDGRLSVGSDYRIPNTNIFAIGDVVTGPSKIGLAIDHTLKAVRIIDGAISGEKIKVDDMLKRIKRVEKPMLKFVEWRDSISEEICRYLNSYTDIKLESCLSLSPFTRIFIYTKCIECETCNAVCSFIHDGRSLIKIRKTEDGLAIPTSCLHCINAKCVAVCRKNAIIRGKLGEILIDYRKCNKCMDCVNECPIKAIRISRGDIVNCDLCQYLVRGGLEPACIAMCPARVIALTTRRS